VFWFSSILNLFIEGRRESKKKNGESEGDRARTCSFRDSGEKGAQIERERSEERLKSFSPGTSKGKSLEKKKKRRRRKEGEENCLCVKTSNCHKNVEEGERSVKQGRMRSKKERKIQLRNFRCYRSLFALSSTGWDLAGGELKF